MHVHVLDLYRSESNFILFFMKILVYPDQTAEVMVGGSVDLQCSFPPHMMMNFYTTLIWMDQDEQVDQYAALDGDAFDKFYT